MSIKNSLSWTTFFPGEEESSLLTTYWSLSTAGGGEPQAGGQVEHALSGGHDHQDENSIASGGARGTGEPSSGGAQLATGGASTRVPTSDGSDDRDDEKGIAVV